MKRVVTGLVIVVCLLMTSGCYDQMALEDSSLTLMLGLDLDEKNNLIIFQQSPVFYKEAKEKSESIGVKVTSVRESRTKFDSIATGLTIGGKIQTILLGKRLLQERKDWFQLLDVLIRDPKSTVTPRMILVDGPIGDIFDTKPRDKPRLSLHMRKLIDTASHRIITTSTTLQKLSWQMEEKGTTPSISNVKMVKEQIRVTGTGLMHKDGSYATAVGLQESSLLLILQKDTRGDISLSIPVAESLDPSESPNHVITINVKKFKMKIKSRLNDQTGFAFDVDLKMAIDLTSRDFELDIAKQQKQLEAAIASELQQEFTDLVAKCQENEIDPFGFGLYVRAYHYSAWKNVQNDWAAAFAKSKVTITPKVELKLAGATK